MSRSANARRHKEEGYTLLEIVAVLAVFATAAALAYPALSGLRQGQDLEGAASGLAQCLRLAHWRAVVLGKRVRVTPRPGPAGGWHLRVEREEGTNWVSDGEDRAVPRGVVLSIAGPEEKVFNPDGTCSFGSVTLRGPGGQAYRCTLAPASGRVRLYGGDREAGRGL
jgi:prepilin-type N-terminal cleavage/methylation domain-containing protein